MFLVTMAKKISSGSYDALTKFIVAQNIQLEPARKQAWETFLRLAWTN